MKTDKVTYQTTFPVAPFLNDKIGFEITLEEGDTEEDALTYAKKKAEDWHRKANPHIYAVDLGPLPTLQPKEIAIEKPLPEEQRIAQLISDIYNCTILGTNDGLESYKGLVQRENKADITAAYNVMHKKLSK